MKRTYWERKASAPLVVLVGAMTSVFIVSAVSLTGQVLPERMPPLEYGSNGSRGFNSWNTEHRLPPPMHNAPESNSSEGWRGHNDRIAPPQDDEIRKFIQKMEGGNQMEQRNMPQTHDASDENSSARMEWEDTRMQQMQENDEWQKKIMEMKFRMMEQNGMQDDYRMSPPMHGKPTLQDMWDSTDMNADHPAASYSSDGSMMNTPPAGYEDEISIPEEKKWFSDVPETDPVGEAANFLANKGVVGGYPDGTFRPDKTINRAEAAKFLLLARMGEIPEMPNDGQFSDVADGQWYTKFVVSAASMGIIGGYKDHTFGPAKEVNTAEFLKMLSITFNLEATGASTYDDVPADAWFASFAAVAQEQGLLPNREMSLLPNAPITRGEAVYAIAKIMKSEQQ
jgi:hypothetical protein